LKPKHPLVSAGTFSKDPRCWAGSFEPQALVRGDGSRVQGRDGNWYIDWVSGLGVEPVGGTNNLGFTATVQTAICDGIAFSLPHRLEYEVAEKLADLVTSRLPHWHNETIGVRFGKTGSAATSMAVRLARAVTGRTTVVKTGYHGWHDWTIANERPALGIPSQLAETIKHCPFGDIQSLTKTLTTDKIAAVIIEHPLAEPEPDWYASVRELCNVTGTLFILDEVVTGFRYAIAGAAEKYGIEPDIICYGKALGNGMPISAIVAPYEMMEWFARTSPVFCSTTNAGETLSLAAANYILENWKDVSVGHLYYIGNTLMQGLSGLGIPVKGNGVRSLLDFPIPARTRFTIEMAKRGVLMNRPTIPTLAHNMGDVHITLQAARETIGILDKLDGEDILKPQEAPWILFREQLMMEGDEPWILFSSR